MRRDYEFFLTRSSVHYTLNIPLSRRWYYFRTVSLPPYILGDVAAGLIVGECDRPYSTRLSVVCASSGDDQTMVAPTVIVSFSSCCIRLLFYSFETNLLFSTMATQAPFRTMFFSSTSYMKFTDSSVLPLQFSLQRQPRYASSIWGYEQHASFLQRFEPRYESGYEPIVRTFPFSLVSSNSRYKSRDVSEQFVLLSQRGCRW